MTEPTRRSIARRLAGSASAYGVAFLAPRVLRLVVVPLVVVAVGFEVYGRFVLLTLILPFAHVLCELGMGTAALRLAPHEPPSGRAAIFSSLITARAAFASVVGAALIFGRARVARLVTGTVETSGGVVLIAASLFAFTLVTAFADQLRSEERHRTLAGIGAAREGAEALLTFAFVLTLRWGLGGLLLAQVAANAGMLLCLAVACRQTFRARPSLARIAELARLGAPFVPYYFLVCLRDLDRYLIKAVLGVDSTGRYDLAMRIVGPVALGNTALAMVLEPYAYRSYASPEAARTIAMFLRVYVVAFGTVAFAASAIAPEVFPLLSPGAEPSAAAIAPSLVFAFVGDGVVRVAGIGADFAKRTGAWVVVAAAHLAVALPATWFLLRPLGIFAAASALLVGTLVAAEVAYALSRRLYPLALPIHRAVLVILAGALAITLLVGGAGFVAPLSLRLAAVPAFFAAAWAVTGLGKREARAVLAAVETVRARARGDGTASR